MALLLFPLISQADVLVVVSAKSALTTLDKNQVRDVFLGKVTSLPDGRSAALIDQPESSPLREEFYSKVTNKSAAQAKAYWAKLSFTGRGVPPHESTDSGNIKKMINSTPGAIGYIEKSAVDDSVKVIFKVE